VVAESPRWDGDFGLVPILCFDCTLGFGWALHGNSGIDRVGTGSVVLSACLSSAVTHAFGARATGSANLGVCVSSGVSPAFGAGAPLRIRPCVRLSLEPTTTVLIAARIFVTAGIRAAVPFGVPVPLGARICGAANGSTRGIAAGSLLISLRMSEGNGGASLI